MNVVYILMGTNLGDRVSNILKAKNAIISDIGSVVNESSIYETTPWGIENQPSFLNMVVKVDSFYSGADVLTKLLDIEIRLGRVRKAKWTERIIDLDILYFNKDIVTEKNLKIPHPEIQNRKFTLIPLCEIDGEFIHPVLNVCNQVLLNRCKDDGIVSKTSIIL